MMNSAADEAVVVDRLRVVRGGTEVLPDLSFSVPRGSVTGLLGPSGCGKTTLMRAVVGVQQVAGGQVTVLGEPAGSAPLRDQVGYVTQAASVYADLTVEENLRYVARLLRVGRDDVDRVLDAVDLTPQRGQLVASLSGGQRNRVSLAAALMGRPRLLVLDEPTVGLDPVLREELWDLFRSLADDGVTLLVSSHVMDEAARCDRLLLMRDGRLVADATPADVRREAVTDDLEQAFLELVRRDAARSRHADLEVAA